MLLLALLLSKKQVNNQNYYLFAESPRGLPTEIKTVSVHNLSELSQALNRYEIDILVVNKIGANTLDDAFFNSIKSNHVKVVVWGHCFMSYCDLLKYAKNDKVSRIVAVGKEELLTWCDHPAYDKSTYIYNICNYPNFDLKPFTERSNNVVYIGSIVPLKGLHHLTTAWPKVLESIPDAQLFIIGSGNLYDKNAKLGKYGIADYFYEKKLLKPVLDHADRIIDSVHFCGVMGSEKFEVLNEAKVGVPNPSGLTETFGFTAVEMQLAGNLVATIACPGYMDTVDTESSILYNSTDMLADSIVKLLKRQSYDPSNTITKIRESFGPEKLINQWISLFNDIFENRLAVHPEFKSDLRATQRKMYNKKLQSKIPCLPSLMFYEDINKKIVYYFTKLVHLQDTFEKIYLRKIKNEND